MNYMKPTKSFINKKKVQDVEVPKEETVDD